jgi:hypothetical protein
MGSVFQDFTKRLKKVTFAQDKKGFAWRSELEQT